MRFLISILFFSSSFLVFSQIATGTLYDSIRTNQKLEFTGNVDIAGTSIRSELSRRLLFGGEIDNPMKERSLKSHGDNNRFGIYSTVEFVYSNGQNAAKNQKKWGWHVKAGNYVVGNINYTKDAFQMAFYGNVSFQNDTAFFSGTRVRFTNFQKIGFGLDHLTNGLSFTFNIVNVQSDVNAYVRKGRWIDKNSSSTIEVEAQADTYSRTEKFSNGLGVAIDAKYQFQVPWGKGKAPFEVSIQNIGAAYMYSGQQNYGMDTSFTYSGFNLNQIISSNVLFSQDDYLLDTLNIRQDTVKRWMMLPGYIQAGKLINYNSTKKLQTFFGIRFYPTIGAVPQGYVGLAYRFVPAWSVMANAAYGGSTSFRAGLSVSYHTNSWRIQLGTDDFYGVIAKKGFGTAIGAKLTWLIANKNK